MMEQDLLSLHILGCGDAFSSGGRNHTSFLLSGKDTNVLIDCGASTPMALKRAGFTFNDIDCVVLSHFHGDHFGGLPYLILEGAKMLERTKPLRIVAPPGLEEKLSQLLFLLYPGAEDALEAFPIHYIGYKSAEQFSLPGFSLTAYEVSHTPQTLPHGLRLELGAKVLAYSGDSSWHENLVHLSRGADLFICECNFYEKDTPSHLSYKTLEQKLEEITARRIVLTHLGADMLRRKEELALEVLEDGQQLNF